MPGVPRRSTGGQAIEEEEDGQGPEKGQTRKNQATGKKKTGKASTASSQNHAHTSLSSTSKTLTRRQKNSPGNRRYRRKKTRILST